MCVCVCVFVTAFWPVAGVAFILIRPGVRAWRNGVSVAAVCLCTSCLVRVCIMYVLDIF